MRTGELRLVQQHKTRAAHFRLLVDLDDDLYELDVTPHGVFSKLLVEGCEPVFEFCPCRDAAVPT